MGGYTLRSFAFRREREANWQALDDLVTRAEAKGTRALSPAELVRLPELYRGALSSLSVARAISLDKNLTDWLEGLCARAHLVVYAPRRRGLQAIFHFFERDLPRLVWGMRAALGLSVLLLLAGVATGWVLTAEDPSRFYAFVDAEYAQERGPEASTETLRAVLYDDGDASPGELSGFTSWLFAHNTKIGLLCFIAGIAAGVPAMLLVFINGLVLGAFLALYASRGLGLDMLAWLLPHGVTELLAVCLCGAAGLTIGHSVVFPGPHRRLDNLALRGREAAQVAVGAAALFFIAALLEGFFRQLVGSIPIRLTIAALTAAWWAGYLGLHARRVSR